MADKHQQSPEHQRAHDLAEQALDKAEKGNTAAARKLLDQAKGIDPKIGEEMTREIEEERRQAESFQGKGTSKG
ncbi:MAG TPA: hypothetical protein VEY95_15975 [Azospirillaceae bacterium]|nr:hypothetical protein [Azospirillaceae bacterium]